MDQLSPEQRKIGRDNFDESGWRDSRREFLQGVIGAVRFRGWLGCHVLWISKVDDPVRVGVIGTGDEGNVLIGGCTPDYVKIVAIADVRLTASIARFMATGPRQPPRRLDPDYQKARLCLGSRSPKGRQSLLGSGWNQ